MIPLSKVFARVKNGPISRPVDPDWKSEADHYTAVVAEAAQRALMRLMKTQLEQSKRDVSHDILNATPDPGLHGAVTPSAVARLLHIEERYQQPDGSQARTDSPSMLYAAVKVLGRSPDTIADDLSSLVFRADEARPH